MQRPVIRILALLAGLALVASACGGGGEESSGDGSSSQATSSGQANDSGPSGSADIEFGGGFDGSVADCTEIASAFGLIVLGPSMLMIQGDEGLDDVREELSGRSFTVPAELEEPFGIIDAAFADVERALDGASLTDAMTDPQVMERLEEAGAAYDTPEVQGALEDVSAFLQENCSDLDPGDLGN